jgi:excisionase family DNA binding protein
LYRKVHVFLAEKKLMEQTPNFDTLPGMVYGLKQDFLDFKTKFENFLNNAKPQVQTDEQRFYGDKELAEYLNCTIQTVSRQKQAGRLPFHRYGRKYFYLRSEIDLATKGRS